VLLVDRGRQGESRRRRRKSRRRSKTSNVGKIKSGTGLIIREAVADAQSLG
jgi:hypothetical protein